MKADTKRLAAGIEQEEKNATSEVEAQVKELAAGYASRMAKLDAERTRETGDAKAGAGRVGAARADAGKVKSPKIP